MPKRITARVSHVESLGPGIGQVILQAPDIAQNVQAGQFGMLQALGHPECVLLRPFSYFTVYDTDHVGFLLRDVGRATHALLHARVGDPLVVLGPLGNTFPPPPKRCWAVAGGVGAAPFGMFKPSSDFKILLGARGTADSGFMQALEQLGSQVELATEDGSAGFHGNVVELLQSMLAKQGPPEAIYTCGATAMMSAVAKVAKTFGIACWVNLEARMGCGIGICRGCAHADATGNWRCICVDGPVYTADEIFAT